MIFDSAAAAGWACCAKIYFRSPQDRGVTIDVIEISQEFVSTKWGVTRSSFRLPLESPSILRDCMADYYRTIYAFVNDLGT